MKLTSREKDLMVQALNMRINYMTTRNVALTVNDAIACGNSSTIVALSEDQKKLVADLESLRTRVLVARD